jgi:hypothetical protein
MVCPPQPLALQMRWDYRRPFPVWLLRALKDATFARGIAIGHTWKRRGSQK